MKWLDDTLVGAIALAGAGFVAHFLDDPTEGVLEWVWRAGVFTIYAYFIGKHTRRDKDGC